MSELLEPFVGLPGQPDNSALQPFVCRVCALTAVPCILGLERCDGGGGGGAWGVKWPIVPPPKWASEGCWGAKLLLWPNPPMMSKPPAAPPPPPPDPGECKFNPFFKCNSSAAKIHYLFICRRINIRVPFRYISLARLTDFSAAGNAIQVILFQIDWIRVNWLSLMNPPLPAFAALRRSQRLGFLFLPPIYIYRLRTWYSRSGANFFVSLSLTGIIQVSGRCQMLMSELVLLLLRNCLLLLLIRAGWGSGKRRCQHGVWGKTFFWLPLRDLIVFLLSQLSKIE